MGKRKERERERERESLTPKEGRERGFLKDARKWYR